MNNFKKIIHRVIQKTKEIFKLESFGLNKLDLKIRPFLSQIPNGFFVEAGANNGLRQSNTYYFEKYLGWKGLLIEPIPELFEECKKNRSDCLVENSALVSNEYAKPTIKMHFSGLMSLVEGSMNNKEEEKKHIERGCALKKLTTYEIDTPANTLTSILIKHKIDKINFLSLDIEGYELEALKGLDLEKFRPEYILVEARYRDDIIGYLGKFSYSPIETFNTYDILFVSQI